MNADKALLILGISSDVSESELKKKYHILMNMTHPDVVESHNYPYEAHEINEAYEYLIKHLKERSVKEKKTEEKRIRWNAPVNPNAFAEREIYQYYEDQDGKNIGFVTVDKGKYLWIEDEDFPLFLKSLYSLGKKIISDDDEIRGCSRTENMDLLADIVYLLAGQFFGTENALGMMKRESKDGGEDADEDIYFVRSMLELLPEYEDTYDKEHVPPGPGASLIPVGIKDHRLYVKDTKGNVLGYITFMDDRILFGIIPMFERRAAMLKLRVSSGMKRGSVDVDMWLKAVPEDSEKAVESINLKIRNLLDKY